MESWGATLLRKVLMGLLTQTDRCTAEVDLKKVSKINWGRWIRTTEWRDQNPLPYRLAMPQLRRSTNLAMPLYVCQQFGYLTGLRHPLESLPWDPCIVIFPKNIPTPEECQGSLTGVGDVLSRPKKIIFCKER